MDVCPACGGPLRAWRRAAEHEPGCAAQPGCLQRCRDCGTAVTAGDAPPAEAHEAGAYRPGAPRGARLAAPLLAGLRPPRRLGCRWRDVGAVARARRLLDVGRGAGALRGGARGRPGWDARGIEPSRRSSAPSTSRPSALEDARVEPASLDAITLWHVLEHVDDPAGALARLHGWLGPGGVLLVGVPNLDIAAGPASAGRAGITSTCRATARTSPRAGSRRCWTARASRSSTSSTCCSSTTRSGSGSRRCHA